MIGDISKWDTSNVTDMSYIFENSKKKYRAEDLI